MIQHGMECHKKSGFVRIYNIKKDKEKSVKNFDDSVNKPI